MTAGSICRAHGAREGVPARAASSCGPSSKAPRVGAESVRPHLTYSRYALILRGVITSFADRRTKELFGRDRVKGLSVEVQRSALRKLLILDAAARIEDLRVPPGNRLESLRGSLRGFHSIRVNDQWRIVFRWSEGNASDVRIIDYH
jgi:proteic killer suppression protein